MSDPLHDEVVAKNAAWWSAHPDFKAPTTGTADSLARSVVHWHHNVESRRRHEGWSAAENDEFFRRQYAIAATQAWLVEAQAKLDTLGPTSPETWYQKRDLEVEIRVLQHALDDFEWNTRNPQCKP
jgi:hypothetical protein